ncbi:MAG: DNA repair protein RadC [Lachnospiraceae bacterium]
MTQSSTIKEMLEEERPYEKCRHLGGGALTNIELLAVLLRSGSKGENSLLLAKRLLYPNSPKDKILAIHQWTYEKLIRLKGIGPVKAVQILCLLEFSKRLSKASAEKGLRFTEPASIAEYYMEEMRHQRQENIKLLMLNSKAKLIGETNVSKGTVNGSMITPRELFIEALEKNAVSIILLHNHPSGDPTPSKDDILITRRIREAGNLIGIELLDHIIIGNHCYISFVEKELL